MLRQVNTAVSGQGHFQDVHPRFGFWHICHANRHGHFTLKQLRLSLVNEMHTNVYSYPIVVNVKGVNYCIHV